MKKIYLLMLMVMVAGAFSANAQDFKAKYFTFGGKKEQKELKKIFINDFVVRQILRRHATAKAGGGLTADPAYAHMTVDFGGVDKDAYQALVTEMYKYTVDKFKGLGYEIITGDDAKAKTDKELKTYPLGDPENMDRVGLHNAIRPKDQLFFNTKSLFANNNYMKLAKDLEAITFSFAFQVEYVAYSGSGGGMFASKANLEANPYLAVSEIATAAVSKGMASITIGPQKAADDWVGPEGFKKTSSQKISSSLFGSGTLSSSAKYTVDINQDKYLSYLKDYMTKEIDASIANFIEEATK